MIPRTLEGWTLESIEELLDAGCHEDQRFDWKQTYPKDDVGKDRLVQVAVGMANAGQGFIIFGVADKEKKGSKSRVVGIPRDNEFAANFKAQLHRADPPVDCTVGNPPIPVPGDSSAVLYVVEVLPHKAPHSFKHVFYARTTGGTNERLGTEKVRNLFVDEEQAILDAPLLNEVDKIRLRLSQGGTWDSRSQALDELSSYTMERSPRVRAMAADALYILGTQVRNGMPADVAAKMADIAGCCLLVEERYTREVLKGYLSALETGFALAYDGALYLRNPLVVRVGAGVLERGLRMAIAQDLERIREDALTKFESAIDAAMRSRPSPFHDAMAFLEHCKAQAINQTRNHPPDDLDLRMLEDVPLKPMF